MLFEKPVAHGDIVSIKLSNGEEIITRLEEETADYIKITKPLSFTLGPQGLGMIPWVFLGEDGKVTLDKKNTFFIVASKKEASKQYLEGTTGISLVK